MSAKTDIFKDCLKDFESEELLSYFKDIIDILPQSVWEDEAGVRIVACIKSGTLINKILKIPYVKKRFSKPKQRDCLRIGSILYNCHEQQYGVGSWIEKTTVEHDIKQGLKEYISRLLVTCIAEDQLLVNIAGNAPSIKNLSKEQLNQIRKISIPDPEEWFFPRTYKYGNMSFLLVYNLDKDWLIELKKNGDNPEPLKSYLEEYLP